MTPEELDEARCKEAERIYCASFPKPHRMSTIAARLAREGWTPPETVDPDLLAAREWIKSDIYGVSNASVDAGTWDSHPAIRAYLAGCTRGREGAKGLVEAAEALISISAGPYSYPDLRAALASAKRGG